MRTAFQRYSDELSGNVIPFWESHCPDSKYGAYFTCLDRDGTVYDTDKYMWMQWRITWMFCELYSKVGSKREWFAYLNGSAEPTSMMKGGKWKTFFHLPRMLLISSGILKRLLNPDNNIEAMI